mmetsp:Transcript_15273/g.32396  ORF Transcript_15273/g.32396 Transcript_15273/m.32396 type:complete len:205 (+) Transcript_15273:122-736(+)
MRFTGPLLNVTSPPTPLKATPQSGGQGTRAATAGSMGKLLFCTSPVVLVLTPSRSTSSNDATNSTSGMMEEATEAFSAIISGIRDDTPPRTPALLDFKSMSNSGAMGVEDLPPSTALMLSMGDFFGLSSAGLPPSPNKSSSSFLFHHGEAPRWCSAALWRYTRDVAERVKCVPFDSITSTLLLRGAVSVATFSRLISSDASGTP